MGARQEADHRLDGANLVGRAAVDARAVLQDGAAHDLGFQLLAPSRPGAAMARPWWVARPSMRVPSFRMAPRTISASSFLTSLDAAICCCGSASAKASLALSRATAGAARGS